MSEKEVQEQDLQGQRNYKIEGQHVSSVLSEEEGLRRTVLRGHKGDRGLRVDIVLGIFRFVFLTS